MSERWRLDVKGSELERDAWESAVAVAERLTGVSLKNRRLALVAICELLVRVDQNHNIAGKLPTFSGNVGKFAGKRTESSGSSNTLTVASKPTPHKDVDGWGTYLATRVLRGRTKQQQENQNRTEEQSFSARRIIGAFEDASSRMTGFSSSSSRYELRQLEEWLEVFPDVSEWLEGIRAFESYPLNYRQDLGWLDIGALLRDSPATLNKRGRVAPFLLGIAFGVYVPMDLGPPVHLREILRGSRRPKDWRRAPVVDGEPTGRECARYCSELRVNAPQVWEEIVREARSAHENNLVEGYTYDESKQHLVTSSVLLAAYAGLIGPIIELALTERERA